MYQATNDNRAANVKSLLIVSHGEPPLATRCKQPSTLLTVAWEGDSQPSGNKAKLGHRRTTAKLIAESPLSLSVQPLHMTKTRMTAPHSSRQTEYHLISLFRSIYTFKASFPSSPSSSHTNCRHISGSFTQRQGPGRHPRRTAHRRRGCRSSCPFGSGYLARRTSPCTSR